MSMLSPKIRKKLLEKILKKATQNKQYAVFWTQSQKKWSTNKTGAFLKPKKLPNLDSFFLV